MTLTSFENFKNECLSHISSLQDKFTRLYDLNSYERWDFDEDFGVLHFESDNGRNLYFKYSLVGSFSSKTSTWKWSWDNQYLKESERKNVDKVKAFGEQNGFIALTTGLIQGDEYIGSEMTAISAKVLQAIGMYRFTQDHLTYYIIFSNELTKKEYDELKENAVICDNHGASWPAFVCQHLNKGAYTGFHEPSESDPLIKPEDGYQAWCDECEKIRLQEGEWNDVSEGFAKIRLICSGCFFDIKQRNQTE